MLSRMKLLKLEQLTLNQTFLNNSVNILHCSHHFNRLKDQRDQGKKLCEQCHQVRIEERGREAVAGEETQDRQMETEENFSL